MKLDIRVATVSNNIDINKYRSDVNTWQLSWLAQCSFNQTSNNKYRNKEGKVFLYPSERQDTLSWYSKGKLFEIQMMKKVLNDIRMLHATSVKCYTLQVWSATCYILSMLHATSEVCYMLRASSLVCCMLQVCSEKPKDGKYSQQEEKSDKEMH